jgi:hypothetical protein
MQMFTRIGITLLALGVALPAVADTRFQIRRMTRDDVPRGKGQCDIRLQIDDQVEVTVRGDSAFIRTIAGKDARDDGSECNAPLPRTDLAGFQFEVKDSRNEIRLLTQPDRRNDYGAVVYIHDNAGGFGRYHFRISWDMFATTEAPRQSEARHADDEHRGPFSWNNAVNFQGRGSGSAVYNDSDLRRLSDVNVNIDRGGRIQVSFRIERGRPIVFNGRVVAREGGRVKADVASEDEHLRGAMFLTIDDRLNVSKVALDATDGRDRVRLNWDRR